MVNAAKRYGRRTRTTQRESSRCTVLKAVCCCSLAAFALLNVAALAWNVHQLRQAGERAAASLLPGGAQTVRRRSIPAHERSGGAAAEVSPPRATTTQSTMPLPSWYSGMPRADATSGAVPMPPPVPKHPEHHGGCKRPYDAWAGTEFVGSPVAACGAAEECCRAKGAGEPCYYTAPHRECHPVSPAMTAEAIERAITSVDPRARVFTPSRLQAALGLTEEESSLVDLYAHAKVKRVERLKKSGATTWANGHDNRLWLLYFENEDLEPAIFKTAVIDMVFTKYDPRVKDAEMYDRHNPPAFYINCEFSPLLWINEYIAWALDRTVGAGLTPPTSIRRFSIDEFVALFGAHVAPHTAADLRAALLTNPFTRGEMWQYVPPWYDARFVEGSVQMLAQHTVKLPGENCLALCDAEDRSQHADGGEFCELSKGSTHYAHVVPTEGLSTLVLVDFILNSLDRKINCFLLRDKHRGAKGPSQGLTKDGRKYATVAMIDNEGAGWTAYGYTHVRRHSRVLHYRNDKHYHGWKEKEGLRYAIEKELADGTVGTKRLCQFCPPRLHPAAIARLGVDNPDAGRAKEASDPSAMLSARLLAALRVSGERGDYRSTPGRMNAAHGPFIRSIDNSTTHPRTLLVSHSPRSPPPNVSFTNLFSPLISPSPSPSQASPLGETKRSVLGGVLDTEWEDTKASIDVRIELLRKHIGRCSSFCPA